MGEYAEMMLDGTMCACCGDFLGSDNGFATYCENCAPDFNEGSRKPKRPMGKSTRKLLLKLAASGKQEKVLGVVDGIWSLLNRGYVERCKRPDYWQLTDAGRAKANELEQK